MVRSVLNTNINYIENKNVELEDTKHEASIYELTFNNIDIIIGIGKEKYKYIDEGIIYFPIYLIIQESVQDQIGVFEIKSDLLPYSLDDDGDVDLEKLGDPLFYSFVNDKYLESFSDLPEENVDDEEVDDSNIPQDENKDDDDEEEVYDEEDSETVDPDDIFEKIDEVPNELLPEQTKEDAEKEQTKIPIKSLWIQKYMKSLHYDIIDNEGGGDCMFATVRDAFAFIGKTTSVPRLRNILVKEVNENPEIFENYKHQFKMFHDAVANDEKLIKKILLDDTSLKKRLSNEIDPATRQEIVEQRKEYQIQFKRLKEERKVSKSLLQEYRFMKGVNDIETFKRKLSSCEFWGETWALSTMEKAINIKFILLSHESFIAKDLHNVIQCGQLNDSALQEKGIFEPDFYIILDYTGQHYKLITYRGKATLTFKEIPYNLKTKIVDKCLERNAGTYSLIPDFQKFKEMYNHGKKGTVEEVPTVEMPTDLYDDNVVFQFYIKSDGSKLPGKGSGEKIPKNLKDMDESYQRNYDFKTLHSIPDWRRKLSHFYESEFTLDEKKWLSVEHYYNAQKFKEKYPSFYEEFSLDSNSELSQSVNLVKAAVSKSGKYKEKDGKHVRIRPLKVDINSIESIKNDKSSIMQNSIYAKFTQNDELKTLLMETKLAKLMHFVKASPPIIAKDLMHVRKKIFMERK